MAMVSLELTDEEKGDVIQPIAMSSKPDYSYGLQICFDDETIEKLSIDISTISAGGVLHLEALAKVTSVTISDRVDSDDDGPVGRIELQITDMQILSASDEKPKARASLSRLYTSSTEGN